MGYYKNTGEKNIRGVVWSTKHNRWANVVKANRSKFHEDEVGTYQLIETGDIVIFNFDGKIIFRQFMEGGDHEGRVLLTSSSTSTVMVTPDDSFDFTALLLAYDHAIDTWLHDPEGGDFLPVGYGWDGLETLYDIRKRGKLSRLFWDVPDNVFNHAVVSAGCTSPYHDVPHDWLDAVQLPITNEPVDVSVNADELTTLTFAIQWTRESEVLLQKNEPIGDMKYTYTIEPDAYKALVGRVSRRQSGSGYTASWVLYHR